MLTRTDRRRFPILLAVIAALAMAMLFSPVQAQEGSAPDQPTGLEATATHDSVTLTWDDPQDDSITGYVILRRIPAVDPEGHFSELVSDTGTDATTYTDDTVSAETRYTYRIKAINEHGVSERSRWFHIDTPAAPEPEEEQAAEPPDKPRGLEATATHDSVTLTWDDPQDDSITGYVILRRIPGVDPQGQFSELVSNTGTDATTYTDDTVSAETRYTYRIKAINEHGVSERSRWSHIDVPAAPGGQQVQPPAAPQQVLFGAGHDIVLLRWLDPQDDSITGYRILRADIVGGARGEFAVLIEDTDTGATTYTDDTVEPETSYVYRVLAINPGGVSEPSSDVEVRTNAPVGPQEPPTGAPGNVSEGNVAVLLSNLGQATDEFASAGVGAFDAAQGFTTGSARSGYFLDSIKLDVKEVPNTPADVTVQLWSASNGNPDASIATLTHSTGSWDTGVNTFSASPAQVLAATTKYFVVLLYSGARTYLNVNTTETPSADDASTEWEVTGRRLERGSDNQWRNVSGQYLKFSVRGQVTAEGGTDLPADATTNGVVEVDGYAARGAIYEPDAPIDVKPPARPPRQSYARPRRLRERRSV